MMSVPSVLGDIPSLTRLGLKSNGLTDVRAASLPPHLQHLILTDNAIATLSVAVFERLGKSIRKLMLSHNRLKSLPAAGIELLHHLELIRLSNNKLESVPRSLFLLPRIAWIALSGNTELSGTQPPQSRVPTGLLSEVTFEGGGNNLGQGASGEVRAGVWKGNQVAVKTFRSVTSDGAAADELALYAAVGSSGSSSSGGSSSGGSSNNLVQCLAVSTTENAVLMARLPNNLVDLALPPTIEEVIEDRWAAGVFFSLNFVVGTLRGMVGALSYLHATMGIAHGDVYAHNMLVSKIKPTGMQAAEATCFLLDLGAAYAYKTTGKGDSPVDAEAATFAIDSDLAERVEVRAFGILASELLSRVQVQEHSSVSRGRVDMLQVIVSRCLTENVVGRPSFVELKKWLENVATLKE